MVKWVVEVWSGKKKLGLLREPMPPYKVFRFDSQEEAVTTAHIESQQMELAEVKNLQFKYKKR